MSEDYKLIQQLATYDVAVLEEKGKTYGDSWRKRGGAGAFMMLSRKWDRIENIALGAGYDIFKAGADNTGDILDDIADLRRYLLLVEAHIAGAKEPTTPAPVAKPIPVCPECRKDAITESTVVYRKGECPIHSEEDCGPGAGYVNQDREASVGPWVPNTSHQMPEFSSHDEVLHVQWMDGTHSTVMAWEFGNRPDVPMNWTDVRWYRIIPYGAPLPPLPQPHKSWDHVPAPDGKPHGSSDECLACQGAHPKGAQCPNLTPHAGSHQHTINVGHYLDVGGLLQPSYSHTTLAGIASAVSGINAAVSAMPKV